MKLETKYNIGDKIWVVYENNAEVSLYSTTIREICIDNNGLYYITEEINDYKENQIIPYNEKEKLLDRIETIMNEINEREGKEDESNRFIK